MAPVLIACILALHPATAPDAPKLTVVISIDQFRGDYVTRFANLYLPATSREGVGGFRWLTQKGAFFVNSEYDHVPTETGPGHAIIGTGSKPSLTGIVANNWFDRASGKDMYCVADAGSKDVLTGAASFSPKNLQVTTFGDELKRATGGQSKNVSIALKDRAAILMAGHIADDVIWFDSKLGSWTSSDYYCKGGKLSDWVVTQNGKKLPDKQKGQSWTKSLPETAYAVTSIPDKPGSPDDFGKTFPHPLPKDGATYYSSWMRTPWANEFVFDTARAAVESKSLGKDDTPDVLTINLSTNDYVGHWFGPDSPEVLDLAVQTDKELSSFFRYLDKAIPGGLENVMIIVTADHGVLPMPEELTKSGLPGGRYDMKKMETNLKADMLQEMEVSGLIKSVGDYMIYLDQAALGNDIEPSDAQLAVRDWLRKQPEIFSAYTRWEIEEQMLPNNEVARMLENSYHTQNSGDVFFFFRPGWYPDSFGSGTGHGSPWTYDRKVPLLMAGKWVQSGKFADKCGPKDIAATVCSALGILPPSGNVGRALAVKN